MVRSALIAGIGIFCSSILSAAHVHCAVIPWSAPVIGTLPTVPTDYGGTDAGLTFFRVFISVPAPPIQGPGCGYEISDVTSISVTLTLTGGPITWDHFELSAQAAPNNVTFPGGGAFGGTGTGTIIETLPPHQSPALMNSLLPQPCRSPFLRRAQFQPGSPSRALPERRPDPTISFRSQALSH